MPAIASDRLVDLHNDVTHYDTMIAEQMKAFMNGMAIATHKLYVDHELEEALRSFKTHIKEEVECRRELLRYKRGIDAVVRELHRQADIRLIA